MGSLCDREVACSASDCQGLNFESCVWRAMSSHSSHHPQEVLLAQFSLCAKRWPKIPFISFPFFLVLKYVISASIEVKSDGRNTDVLYQIIIIIIVHISCYYYSLHSVQSPSQPQEQCISARLFCIRMSHNRFSNTPVAPWYDWHVTPAVFLPITPNEETMPNPVNA